MEEKKKNGDKYQEVRNWKRVKGWLGEYRKGKREWNQEKKEKK